MIYLSIILSALFGFLGTMCLGLLGAKNFTDSHRRKYPILKILDGKQIYLLIGSILCYAVSYLAGGWKEVLNVPPSVAVIQKQNDSSLGNNSISVNLAMGNNYNQVDNTVFTNTNTSVIPRSTEPSEKRPPPQEPKREKIKPVYIPSYNLTKARNLYSQGKYLGTINECDKILAINPKNSDALALKRMAQKQINILDP